MVKYRRRQTSKWGRKRKSYSSRLKDSAINTAVEKAAKRIAQEEDRKQVSYYMVRGVYLNAAAIWPANDTWPLTADSFPLGAGVMFYRNFAQIGGYLSNELSNAVVNNPLGAMQDRALRLHIKSMKATFRLLNQGLSVATVDIMIFRVPYSKSHLTNMAGAPSIMDNPLPQQSWAPPQTIYNAFTSQARRAYFTSNVAGSIPSIKHQVVIQKRFKVPVYRQVDAAGGANARLNTEPWKLCSISKTYKGLGLGEDYEFGSIVGPSPQRGRLSRNRYYLAVRADQRILFAGCSGVVFCKGKNFPDQVIFDTIAAGAQ